jgi:DNA-binding NarL/FixJ family response regulator
MRIKTILCGTHRMFIDGLSVALKKDDCFELLALCSSEDEIIDFLKFNTVDIVLLSIDNEPKTSFEKCIQILKISQETKILILSISDDESLIISALEAGANGIIQKKASLEELIIASKAIHLGVNYFPSKYNIYKNFNLKERELFFFQSNENIKKLSDRELEIVQLILQEMSNKEISSKLFLSVHTVNNHRKNIFKKLNVNNVVSLTKLFLRN